MKKNLPTVDFRRAVARRLRMKTTDTEIVLWRRLRAIEVEGTHFRRQVPIGPYVADFACMAARLVIELVWNNGLMNMDGILDIVYAALYGSRDSEPAPLKHNRRKRYHPTLARNARRPSPSRGG